MSDDNGIKDALDELFPSLQLMGEPIDLEDKIIIPVTTMSMAFATSLVRQMSDNLIQKWRGRRWDIRAVLTDLPLFKHSLEGLEEDTMAEIEEQTISREQKLHSIYHSRMVHMHQNGI